MELHSGALLPTTEWCDAASLDAINREIRVVSQYLARLYTASNLRMIQLPGELLNVVFDEVCADDTSASRRDTRACALACSQFVPYAQARLFSSLRFRTARDCQIALEVAAARPNLYRLADTVALEWDVIRTPEFSARCRDLLAPLEGVSKLTYTNWDTFGARPIEHILALDDPQPVIHLFSAITHLTIDKSKFRKEDDIISFISYFPKMKALSLDESGIEDFEIEPATISLPPKQLRLESLEIGGVYMEEFSWLYPSLAPDTLLSLSCPLDFISSSTDVSVFERALETFGRSLRRIYLGKTTSLGIESIAATISRICPNLDELALGTHYPTLESVIPILQALNCAHLRTFSLPMDHDPDLNLDVVLLVCRVAAALPSLRSVIFDCDNRWNGELLYDLEGHDCSVCATPYTHTRESEKLANSASIEEYDLTTLVDFGPHAPRSVHCRVYCGMGGHLSRTQYLYGIILTLGA